MRPLLSIAAIFAAGLIFGAIVFAAVLVSGVAS